MSKTEMTCQFPLFNNFEYLFGILLPMNEPTLTRAERQRIQLQADILEAAFLEFSERGYHQTAISDISQTLRHWSWYFLSPF